MQQEQRHPETATDLPLRPQGGMELSHGLDDPQPGPHRPLGVIFVRQGVAEVDQEPIAEVLGDMPLEAGDHFGAGGLIVLHHLAQLFRVELARQARRVHQITEQDGELPSFGDVSLAAPVHHQGELLGALVLDKAPSDPITPAETKLVQDLAAQAGLVLRNARLTAELVARLRSSRPLASGSWPRATRRADASSATSTMAPSSSSWRWP